MEELKKGKISIMLSAPHAVNHLRNGKIKSLEVNTDTLICNIKEKVDVSIIYKTKSNDEDANYDVKSKYKDKAVEFIKKNNVKLLLDIHGMNYKRKEGICIGTAHGKNINGKESVLKWIVDTFKEHYPIVTIDKPFSADNANCVSTYVAKHTGIPAFQIEINNRYRFPGSTEFNLTELEDIFVEIIKGLILNNILN